MYTIVGHPASRAMRVAWVLEELGQPYGWRLAEPRSPEIFAVNPLGKVPALVMEDQVLYDSIAICQFLADRHGGLTHPPGSTARAHQDAILNHIVAEVDAALWTASKHRFVLPEEHRKDGMGDVALFEFGKAMTELDALKGDAPFLAGDFCTVPDLVLCHCAGWAYTRRFPLPSGAFGDYLKSVRKRPSIAAAQAKAKSHGG